MDCFWKVLNGTGKERPLLIKILVNFINLCLWYYLPRLINMKKKKLITRNFINLIVIWFSCPVYKTSVRAGVLSTTG